MSMTSKELLVSCFPLCCIPLVHFPDLFVWTQAHVCWHAHRVSQLCCLSVKRGLDERSLILPPPTTVTCSVLSWPRQHGWPRFPLSALRYNVNCHQGPFHPRQKPAAGCLWRRPVGKEGGVILSVHMLQVKVHHCSNDSMTTSESHKLPPPHPHPRALPTFPTL